jgi:flagellar basal body-associated protein FliL
MTRATKILDGVLKGLAFLVFVNIALLCMAMAYIMFAPNSYPKPFTLVYGEPQAGTQNFLSGVLTNMRATEEPTAEPTSEVMPGEGVMVDMSTKIINLADTTGRRYIRLTVVLEFAPELQPVEATKKSSHGDEEEAVDPLVAFQEQLAARMPLMDDVVITLLSTKSYENLYTADGKENLRVEIMNAINERLPEFHIISVYFTEFVVQ